MSLNSNLTNLTKNIYNPKSIICYGLACTLFPMILSLNLFNYTLETEFIRGFLVGLLCSKISSIFFKPYFERKRIKTTLSLPITRINYYKEYLKVYFLLISTNLVSMVILCLIMPRNIFDFIGISSIFIFIISYNFLVSINQVELFYLERMLSILWSFILFLLLILTFDFIEFQVGDISSLYMFLLSLIYMIFVIYKTKSNFLKKSY